MKKIGAVFLLIFILLFNAGCNEKTELDTPSDILVESDNESIISFEVASEIDETDITEENTDYLQTTVTDNTRKSVTSSTTSTATTQSTKSTSSTTATKSVSSTSSHTTTTTYIKTDNSTETEKNILSFSVTLPANKESNFYIQTDDGKYTYDKISNTYKITSCGIYDFYGNLYDGKIEVSADSTSNVDINLNGCVITNSKENPISVFTANNVSISAKNNTINKIYDLRTVDENASGSALYAECDLTLKGNGSLEIISNYNNAVHTKDDLKIKNLTLVAKAINNALKGNDSVTIESGNITAISLDGDAIKTTSTDISKNGKQRGIVEIQSGKIALYAAFECIDAATDTVISDTANVETHIGIYN